MLIRIFHYFLDRSINIFMLQWKLNRFVGNLVITIILLLVLLALILVPFYENILGVSSFY